MRFSYSTARPMQQQIGFTLLEIMVTLVVIGVILSFATLSVNNNTVERTLQQEARRVAGLLELAQEEAILQGVNRGFLVTEGGFYFLSYGSKGWQVLDKNEEIFYPRLWQSPWRLTFALEGETLPLLSQLESDALKPQLYLLASGELATFTLTIAAPEASQIRYQVSNESGYKIEVRRVEGIK